MYYDENNIRQVDQILRSIQYDREIGLQWTPAEEQ